jgi:hypothetical protein
MKKLHELLAKTDHLGSVYRGMVSDFVKFFKKDQGAFRGMRKTYVPRDGTIDDPSQRGIKLVSTTVQEKLDWFIAHAGEYVDSALSQERTNASLTANSTLIVDGVDWGLFSSLELLRLKSIIEAGDFKELLNSIPVRSDSEVWHKSDDAEHAGREIYADEKVSGVVKTTDKEDYILPDPNIGKDKSYNPSPQVAKKTTVIELGDYTLQRFSGEISHRERAMMLERATRLYIAVLEALKRCNDAEVLESELNAERVFGYIFYDENQKD